MCKGRLNCDAIRPKRWWVANKGKKVMDWRRREFLETVEGEAGLLFPL